jgi:hypothetical protein
MAQTGSGNTGRIKIKTFIKKSINKYTYRKTGQHVQNFISTN